MARKVEAGCVVKSTDFGLDVTSEQWEDAVFREAEYYTVVSGRSPFNRVKRIYKTWSAAKLAAEPDITMMVYAVTAEGRSVMLPRSKWDHYDQIRSED